MMTALHWAAANGCVDLVTRLLERGALLEAENRWGGTVLDSTLHFALHDPVPGVNYAAVMKMLVAAGANVGALDPAPTGNAAIDELLHRRQD
jgi:hypothetical protein